MNEISILLFEKGSLQPKEIKVPFNNQWQNYQIILSDLRNADLSEISNISFVVSQTLGEFEFIIDNIEFK